MIVRCLLVHTDSKEVCVWVWVWVWVCGCVCVCVRALHIVPKNTDYVDYSQLVSL